MLLRFHTFLALFFCKSVIHLTNIYWEPTVSLGIWRIISLFQEKPDSKQMLRWIHDHKVFEMSQKSSTEWAIYRLGRGGQTPSLWEKRCSWSLRNDLVFLRQGLTVPLAVWNSLSRQGWPWIQRPAWLCLMSAVTRCVLPQPGLGIPERVLMYTTTLGKNILY